MSYRTRYRIRFGDVDSARIVYYPRYFHLCHVAMEELFREALGVDYATLIGSQHFGFPAIKVTAEFRRPLRYGEEAEIEVEIVSIGESSLTLRFTFRTAGYESPAAVIDVVTVALDLTVFEKRRVPDWVRAGITGAIADTTAT